MGIDALKARAVFLDRDGVLNRTVVRDGAPRPPQAVDEVEVLPGVAEALARLGRRGLLRIVVTNQPDVARGRQTHQVVEAINDHLRRSLFLDAVFTCFHDDRDGCRCRKPAPGLILGAAARHGIDVGRSFMVGDRWSDVAAGQAAGCTTFLIRAPYSERARCRPDHEVGDLAEATREILRQTGPGEEV